MLERSFVYSKILALLAELVPHWQSESWDAMANEETWLVADLDLASVEFIDLFVGIEKALGKTIGFHDLLMVEGRYVTDLTIGQLLDFLEKSSANLDADASSQEAPKPASQATATRSVGTPLTDSLINRFQAIIPKPDRVSEQQVQLQPLVFLLSAPRSGSTLLQTVLAGHPSLFAPPELHLLWFRDLAQRRLAFRDEHNRHLVSGAIRALIELDNISIDEATALMRGFEEQRMSVQAFYSELQRRLGERLLVDKTPANAYSAQVLERAEGLFREPMYLQLVRHPCGAKRSFMDARLERMIPFMQRHQDEFSPEQFAELAWLTCNRNIEALLEQVPAKRQLRICYEDLVLSPEQTIRRVCEFLQIDFQGEMLDPYRNKQQRMADGLGKVGEMSGDLKFHLHNRIEPQAAYRWQHYMSEDEVSEQSWALAERLGYRRCA